MGNSQSNPPDQNLKYSIEVGPDLPGSTKELRNPNHIHFYLETPDPEMSTLQDLFIKSFEKYAENLCLGTRHNSDYHWKKYKEIKDLSTSFASGLISKKLCEESEVGSQLKFLGIYSKNCEAWHVADFGCGIYNITTVALYDTLGADSVEFILNETGMKSVLLSNDMISNLLKLKSEGKTAQLTTLITINPADDLQDQVESHGFKLCSFQDIIETGRSNKIDLPKVSKNSIYTLSYTSGTTGNPKGVIITHGSMLAQIAGILEVFTPSETDVHLSYLPLAHLYERCLGVAFILNGSQIGYYSGDALKLIEDLSILKPTILACVPRLLNRFFDLITANIKSQTGLKAKLIKKALDIKLENSRRSACYTHGLYDSLVFSKINKLLGGRIRKAVTASAPIAADVLNFLKVVFCCQILEAYGLTETGGAGTATREEDNETGHVGGPLGNLSLRLVDIPEMNYYAKGRGLPAGEVCFKGASMMGGYFKNKKATDDVIDSDGWFHSGDIGVLRPNGSLMIVDRKKNVFKLSQGEYVAPEKIENIYIQSKYVAFVYLHGDSLQNYTVSIVVPDESTVRPLARSLGISESWTEICENDLVRKTILDDMTRIGRENKLSSFEQARKIYLHKEVITPESGLVTATFKIRRFDMRNYFKSVIQKMYSSD